jgi:hypothetical protein
MAKIPGLPVAFIGVGGVLVWSGIENQPVSSVLRSLARGQAPPKGPPETFATPGVSSSSSAPFSVSGGASGYQNPFRSVQGLTAERVDQGVDYSGTGPVYALGAGTVVATFNPGWPGGGWIVVHLSGGAAAGHYSYVAENITPAVHIGQQVDSSTVIGNMHGGIETGWAAPPGAGFSMAMVNLQFTGSNATAYGKNYSDLLASLGCPPGIVTGPVRGTVPPGWFTADPNATIASAGPH